MEAALKQVVSDVCEERNATSLKWKQTMIISICWCRVIRNMGYMKLVKQMKGRSSKVLRDNFPALRTRLPTLWTNSYFVATVGGAPLAEVIKQYIEQQKDK